MIVYPDDWQRVAEGKTNLPRGALMSSRCSFCSESFFITGSDERAFCRDPVVAVPMEQDKWIILYPACAEELFKRLQKDVVRLAK